MITAFILTLASLIFPACATEDASGCYWDAAAHGNGVGTSFIAVTDDQIIYF